MDILYTLAKVVFLFFITIFVHELGHFIVARWCGLKIEVFSIGFGPAIWKKKVRDVVYKVGVLPLGGYVALPQMDPSGGLLQESDGAEALPWVAPWKKILVAVAGVICNMLLAYALAWVVYLGGKSYAPTEQGCIVGYVETNSLAYARGLTMGDQIVSVRGLVRDGRDVNEKPVAVNDWDALTMGAAFYDDVECMVRAPDGTTRAVELATEPFMGAKLIGGISPLNYCYVLKVGEGTSAAEAGLQAGDKLLELDGIPLYSREHLMKVVDEHADQLVSIKFERAGQVMESQVRPAYNESEGRALIGITFNTLDVRKPWAQVKSHATLIIRFLKALVTPKNAKEAAKGVGGPIYILALFWYSVQSDIIVALWLTGLINVNLAVLNLLPIPILDGGHVIFALLEAIRRKPLSARLVSAVSNAFFVLLIGLMLLLSYRDILRFPLIAKLSQGVPADIATETNQPPSDADAGK